MSNFIKDLITSAYSGVIMGSKIFWGILSAIAVVAWVWSLIRETPNWTIPSWLFVIYLLIALGIGLTLYMGQRELTKRINNWGQGLERDLQRARNDIEVLQQTIRKLESR